jgi:hypothetical protein
MNTYLSEELLFLVKEEKLVILNLSESNKIFEATGLFAKFIVSLHLNVPLTIDEETLTMINSRLLTLNLITNSVPRSFKKVSFDENVERFLKVENSQVGNIEVIEFEELNENLQIYAGSSNQT